jgi:hypothetical protein
LETRLVPLNAVIDLTTADGINQSALAEGGFHLAGLEIPVVTPRGNVLIDVVLANASIGHLIAIEAKSGSNIVEDQASRYSALQAVNLVRAAFVTLPQRVELMLEVVYVALAEHAEGICLGLQLGGYQFPVVVVHPGEISLSRAEHASPQLQAIFASPIQLATPVGRFISFDHESPISEIRPHVSAALVAELSQRSQTVSLGLLTERATPHYALYGTRTQGALRKKVAKVAQSLAEGAPDTFEWHPTTGNHEGFVKLLRTPEEHDPRGRTQAYQRLSRLGQKPTPIAPPPALEGGEQPPKLLDELEKADIVEDTPQEPGVAQEAGGES